MTEDLRTALLTDVRGMDDDYIRHALAYATRRRDELAAAGDGRADLLALVVDVLCQVRDERRALVRDVAFASSADITDLVRLDDED
jgi:hypothetical protein